MRVFRRAPPPCRCRSVRCIRRRRPCGAAANRRRRRAKGRLSRAHRPAAERVMFSRRPLPAGDALMVTLASAAASAHAVRVGSRSVSPSVRCRRRLVDVAPLTAITLRTSKCPNAVARGKVDATPLAIREPSMISISRSPRRSQEAARSGYMPGISAVSADQRAGELAAVTPFTTSGDVTSTCAK